MEKDHAGHTHSVQSLDHINKAFYIGIGLNILFTAFEFIIGYSSNSLALIADASHNLSDVISLVISLVGMKLAQLSANRLYTYGYRKASILASLINSILLLYVVGKISFEAFERLSSPQALSSTTVIITALIGVIINTISALLFFKGQKQDINIKGAFLHLIVDAIVSMGVVVSGILIYYTNWTLIDPLISIVIAVVILLSTWKLFKESIKLILDGVPKSIDLKKIEALILKHPLIKDVSHLHIWALSSSQSAMTVNVVLRKSSNLNDFMMAKDQIKHELLHQNIQHATIEIAENTEHCQ